MTTLDQNSGLVISRYRKEYDVEALGGRHQGQVYRCVGRARSGQIVTGDLVHWSKTETLKGVIEKRLPRDNLLERPDNFGRLKPVAANINQMLVMTAVKPEPHAELIDRYLVAAELMHVRTILVLNKVDLLDHKNRTQFDQLFSRYARLGYRTAEIVCSRHRPAQLENLEDFISGRTSIVVGQSGVGKSSLINKLLPQVDLPVGGLSQRSGEGTHTTTRAKLFHLPGGGKLIDSPGIRDFSLWHIGERELQSGFIELAQVADHCRFRDCRHQAEPGCAVPEAIQQGYLDAYRFANFIKIRESITAQQARGLTTDPY